MSEGTRRARMLALVGTLGVTLLGSACAHVNREEFQAEMELLRQEMADGDLTVAQRVDGVDTRVDELEHRMQMLEEGLRVLEDEFGVQMERLENSLRVHLPVHFGFDDDRLDPSQLPVLDRVASVLTDYYPEAMLTVEGLTDPVGNPEYNQKLGLRRAESVRSHLVEGGWSESRVRAVSYGESKDRLIEPTAGGPGESGRVNRRAVVVIDHPEGPVAKPVVASSSG